MALEEARMKAAVRLVDRALRDDTDTSLGDRLEGFRAAYGAMAELEAGDEAWSEDVLWAAWSLVEDAYPDGGPVDAVILAFEETYGVLSDTVAPPAPRRQSKPRRDA